MNEQIDIWLVGNTGLRNPNRIQDGFEVFAGSPFVGNLHGKDNEIGFMNYLNEKGIIQNEDGKDESGSHARKWRLMFAKNGFIYPQVKKKDGKVVTSLNPMAAKTVRNIHGTLNKALSVAVSIGYLHSNPAECVILPRVEKKEIHPLTDEQVKEFLKAASSEDYGIALKVILFTGLRESELLGLTWDSVDFKTGSITISKQLLKRKIEDGGSTLSSTKSGKMRIIKPAPFVMELLAQQYKEQAKQRLQSGNQWKGWQTSEEQKTSLVFLTPDGKHLSQTSIRYHFKKVVERIGVPAARVHDLRHTFAVLSLQNGDNIKTVQGNLGHATAAFTLDVYGHVSERMKDDSAARMQAYIENIS